MISDGWIARMNAPSIAGVACQNSMSRGLVVAASISHGAFTTFFARTSSLMALVHRGTDKPSDVLACEASFAATVAASRSRIIARLILALILHKTLCVREIGPKTEASKFFILHLTRLRSL